MLIFIAAALFSALSLSCSPIMLEKNDAAFSELPPEIVETIALSPEKITLVFDKEVFPEKESFLIVPDIKIAQISSEENNITLDFERSANAGEEYFLKGTVSDSSSNSVSMGISFFGFNPDVPDIVINEFTSKGSASHPDAAELFVKRGGDMAGVTLYGGTKSSFADKFIFPRLKVSEGDYIILHFKPEGKEEEKNETEAKNSSGGKDASDTAWDLWIEGGKGLSGNNGTISLYDNPYGNMIDAVIYTDRASGGDAIAERPYRGFPSSKVMLQADEIAASGNWLTADREIKPEECVTSSHSSATRSICRNSTSEDTDSASDWHTVPVSKFSFGRANSDEIYLKEE